MMKVIATSILCVLFTQIFCQKPSIDTSVLGKWPKVQLGSEIISPDGKYVIYFINNLPLGTHTLVAQSTDNTWKKEYIGGENASISDDSKWALFKSNDTLYILSLGFTISTYISSVRDYGTLRQQGHACLYYTIKQKKELFFRQLGSPSEQSIKSVENYYFIPNDSSFYYQEKAILNKDTIYSLHLINMMNGNYDVKLQSQYIFTNIKISKNNKAISYCTLNKYGENAYHILHCLDLSTGIDNSLYKSKEIVNQIAFSHDGDQMIFISEGSIWFYTLKMNYPIRKITNQTSGMPEGLVIDTTSSISFTKDDKNIFFHLVHKQLGSLPINNDHVKVKIWSHNDEYLSANPSVPLNSSYLSLFLMEKGEIVRLERDGESNAISISEIRNNSQFILLHKRQEKEWYWRAAQGEHISIVSLKDGSRKIYNKKLESYGYLYSMSPDEKYIIYFNPVNRNYWSFNINNRHSSKLTNSVSDEWKVDLFYAVPDPKLSVGFGAFGIAGWTEDNRVLIYDKYDLWSFDPSMRSPPVNITKQFGRNHKTTLRIFYRNQNEVVRGDYAGKLHANEEIILKGINLISKQISLYKIRTAHSAKPNLIFEGPYASNPFTIAKASQSNVWIMGRSNQNDAPNLFVAQNLKGEFTRLSNIQPQRKYNWYTSELISWSLSSGEMINGILFKPENFDSTKRYPIIINYYESKSDGLYSYYSPEWMNATIPNIPYLVSNGYLVFLSDIHFKIGHVCKSALDAISSAARHLSMRNYVNKDKMGIMGFSFGGYETNCIITHTRMFAAAAEGAGPSDLISDYNLIDPGGIPYQWLCEVGQNRIGASLWKKPNLYLENSPVFYADKVFTPLLIMHNTEDDAVPFPQGIELFTALRRLRKKVWMLQYEGEGHGLSKETNIIDYTVKLKSFFDYFLKDSPIPDWMRKSVE